MFNGEHIGFKDNTIYLKYNHVKLDRIKYKPIMSIIAGTIVIYLLIGIFDCWRDYNNFMFEFKSLHGKSNV